MSECQHAYQTKGKFYNRKKWIWGGELFTVVRYRECVHCKKQERKVVSKKKVTTSADTYERQLKFSGIKPETQIN